MSRRDARGLLGPLEYDVLSMLWRDAPATVAEVLDRLNARRDADPLAYTTVMTVLARLTDKGLTDREKVGRGYAYHPRYTEPELVAHLGERAVADLVERFGDVALATFAAALEDADPELLRRVAELAARREEGGDA